MGQIHERNRLRSLFAVLGVLAAATGCSTSLERVGFDVRADLSTSATALLSEKFDDTKSIEEQRIVNEVNATKNRCGGNVVAFRDKDQIKVRITTASTDSQELGVLQACWLSGSSDPLIEVQKEEGFLWDRYKTVLHIRSYYPYYTGSSRRANEPPILFRMPGRDISVLSNSDVDVFNLEVTPISQDQVSIGLRLSPEKGKRANAIAMAACIDKSKSECPEQFRTKQAPFRSHLQVIISTRVYHVTLEEVLSIVGLLFGSGLLVAVAERVRRKRKP